MVYIKYKHQIYVWRTKMICENCGAEMADHVKTCTKCGTKVKPASENDRERHGFVTFYIILLILFAPYSIWQFYKIMPGEIGVTMVIKVISSVLLIIGCILLLNWKKLGFWIIIGTGIIDLILLLSIEMSFVIAFFSSVLGIIILWLVLKIKKNRKTAWEQLD